MNTIKAFLNGFVDGLGFGCIWRYLRKAHKEMKYKENLKALGFEVTGTVTFEDGFYSVEGDVLLKKKCKTLPAKFNFVSGFFFCYNNHLTTLDGAPKEVGGSFICYNNQLTTLNGAPKKVGGTFVCDNNQLTSLEGAPKEVGGFFDCDNNQLTTLAGAPKK